MRGERQIEEEAVCNRKDDLSFRSGMEWNNMLKWVFLVMYCPFSSLLKKPNTFAFGAQMNQRPGCMNNFLFVSRIFLFIFFKLASQKHKIIILLWTTDQGHSPSRQHLGFYLLSLFIYFPAYIFSHSFFLDCCLVLLFLSSDGSSGELCTVEHIDYFLWCFFLFTLSLSSSQGLKIHLFIICVVTNIHNSNFSVFFFLQRLVRVCKTFF